LTAVVFWLVISCNLLLKYHTLDFLFLCLSKQGDILTLPSCSVTVSLFSPCGQVQLLFAGPPMWMHLCRCTFLLFCLWYWSSCPLQGLHFPLSHLGLHLPCISYVTLFLLYGLQLLQLGSLQHYYRGHISSKILLPFYQTVSWCHNQKYHCMKNAEVYN